MTDILAIVKVKTPWYALPFLLRRGFRKAVPQYRQAPGLRFKHFATTADHRFFGGIYLWASLAAAQSWFSAQWFERVRRTYKAKGEVRFYPVLSAHSYVPAGYDFAEAGRHSRVVVWPGATEFANSPQGLLRRYVVREGEQQVSVLLFASEAAANAFLQAHPAARAEVYETPVLLNNE